MAHLERVGLLQNLDQRHSTSDIGSQKHFKREGIQEKERERYIERENEREEERKKEGDNHMERERGK